MAEFNLDMNAPLTINFNATGNAEILQNVAMVLASVVFSCPMDREFAWDGSLFDRPIQVVKALFSSRITAAVAKYEPRAQIVSVSYQGSGTDGLIKPVVQVRING